MRKPEWPTRTRSSKFTRGLLSINKQVGQTLKIWKYRTQEAARAKCCIQYTTNFQEVFLLSKRPTWQCHGFKTQWHFDNLVHIARTLCVAEISCQDLDSCLDWKFPILTGRQKCFNVCQTRPHWILCKDVKENLPALRLQSHVLRPDPCHYLGMARNLHRFPFRWNVVLSCLLWLLEKLRKNIACALPMGFWEDSFPISSSQALHPFCCGSPVLFDHLENLNRHHLRMPRANQKLTIRFSSATVLGLYFVYPIILLLPWASSLAVLTKRFIIWWAVVPERCCCGESTNQLNSSFVGYQRSTEFEKQRRRSDVPDLN